MGPQATYPQATFPPATTSAATPSPATPRLIRLDDTVGALQGKVTAQEVAYWIEDKLHLVGHKLRLIGDPKKTLANFGVSSGRQLLHLCRRAKQSAEDKKRFETLLLQVAINHLRIKEVTIDDMGKLITNYANNHNIYEGWTEELDRCIKEELNFYEETERKARPASQQVGKSELKQKMA